MMRRVFCRRSRLTDDYRFDGLEVGRFGERSRIDYESRIPLKSLKFGKSQGF